MEQKKVSVIMATYNGTSYLHDAIKSIINQTYENWELIVCDDCSTDDSYSILQEYEKQYLGKIKVVQNATNSKLAASLNHSLKYATGDYIARMDDDDYSLPNRFEVEVNYLNSHPELSFVCSDVNIFDENGIWGVRKCKMELTTENIFRYHPIVHPTVMIRKDDLLEAGGYTVSPKTSRTEDYDLWCKLSYLKKRGHCINQILFNYRENSNGFKKRKLKYRFDHCKLSLYWRKKLNLPFVYTWYAFKPVLHGLVPSFIVQMYHKRKYNRK